MLSEGVPAPTFALPGVIDGAIREIDIGEYVGDAILVLAFYPADFSPACEEDSCDLTELDLFTMQRDVEVFAVGPDSVYSHRAFAEEYSLSLPLLSDSLGEAIDAYDVRMDGDQLLAERSVFVIDQEGTVQYAWSTTSMTERPNIDDIRGAVSDIGGDSTALGRYRVGHAHYIEARRAFTSAMKSYEDHDWLISQGDFERAVDEFQESADQFESAARFAESEPLEAGFERAQEKATALWQAAEWLAESAQQYASGNGKEANELRRDAEAPLETARDIGEPPDPDDIDLDAAEVVADDDGGTLEAPSEPDAREYVNEPGEGDDSDPATVDAAVEQIEEDRGRDAAGAETGASEPTVETEHDVEAGSPGEPGGSEGVSSAVEFEDAETGDATSDPGQSGTDEPATTPDDDAPTTATDSADEAEDANDDEDEIELDLKDPTE